MNTKLLKDIGAINMLNHFLAYFTYLFKVPEMKIAHLESWPRGYKTFFILNSVEHEILNPHIKNIEKFGFFKAHISLQCYFPAHKC